MAQFSRLAIVIFANEVRVEVDILPRGGGYIRYIFYIAVNSLMVNDARLFQVIERELLWLLQAQNIVLHPGVPDQL